MEPTSNTTTATVDDWRDRHNAALSTAIRALTDAGQLRYQPLLRSDDGTLVDNPNAEPVQTDWAEFVSLAVAGAAANLGGVEAALAGRPGSWEADRVRQLLHSTVGDTDEAMLWQHRTDPLTITLHVDDLLLDSDAHDQYDAAEAILAARWADLPTIDTAAHRWEYTRNNLGQMVPTDPAAPAWSWTDWREHMSEQIEGEELIDRFEQDLRTGPGAATAFVPKTPADADALRRHDAALTNAEITICDLQDRLEQQRRREWAAYGDAVAARIKTLAAAQGLTVPVHVTINIDPSGPTPTRHHEGSLEQQLITAATLDTPTPADLPGTPLERVEGS